MEETATQRKRRWKRQLRRGKKDGRVSCAEEEKLEESAAQRKRSWKRNCVDEVGRTGLRWSIIFLP